MTARMTGGARLAGFGHHAPSRVVGNAELEASLGLAPGWIERRTGILRRRWAAPDETLASVALPAARAALAGTDPAAVGLLLLATSTPDQLLPPTGPAIAHALGLRDAGAMDLAGACVGFLQALALADSYVRTQRRAALVLGANLLSRRIDFADPATACLFADAAGAVLLVPDPDPDRGVIGLHLATDGEGAGLVRIPRGARTMEITDGGALFARALDMMAGCGRRALEAAGLTPDEVTRFVPHQANARLCMQLCRRLGIPPERMALSLAEYGNASAATVPLTLALCTEAESLKVDERLLLTAAGAGLLGAGIVIRT